MSTCLREETVDVSRDQLIIAMNQAICATNNASVNELCYKQLVGSYLHRSGHCSSPAISSCRYCKEEFLHDYTNSTFQQLLRLQERDNHSSPTLDVLLPDGSLKYFVLPVLLWMNNVEEYCAAPTTDMTTYIDMASILPAYNSSISPLRPLIQKQRANYDTVKCATYAEVLTTATRNDNENAPDTSDLYFISSLFLLNHISLHESCEDVVPLQPVKSALFHWLDQAGNKTNETVTEFITENDMEHILREITSSSHEEDKHEHDDHHHHHHHHHQEILMIRARRSLGSDLPAMEQPTCGSVEQIFNSVGVQNHEKGATWNDFQTLCPLLLTYSLIGNCQSNDSGRSNDTSKDITTSGQRYGLGTLAVFLVSGLSFLGVLIIPCLRHKYYDLTLVFFIAMGIGALLGDAILHLIPEIVGAHEEEEGGEHHHGGTLTTMKATCVFFVIYLFFLFESLMDLYGRLHKSESSSLHQSSSEMSITSFNEASENNSTVALAEEKRGSSHGHGHSHGPTNSKLTAFMILTADAIHNFVDGMAIGASFANSLSNGISTSIAVFCHEVPHELGDFAVLLSAGMSVKKAMFLHVLSALPCFAGLYIAIPLSVNPEVQQWIFAITAGMFIYLSLVSMVPSLKSATTQYPLLAFVAQNVGIALGFLFMFLLALLEDKIKV